MTRDWSRCACGRPGVLYPGGRWCDDCRPFPLNPEPDPALTLTGLRAAAGIAQHGFAYAGTSQLNDDRAIASGKRRSTPEQYAAARDRENARRAAELERRGVRLCRPKGQGPSAADLDQVEAFAAELEQRR